MRPACTVRPAQPAPRGHQFAPPAPHQAVVCEAGRPGGMRSARSNLIDHTDFCNKSTPQSTKVPLQSTIQPFVSHRSPTAAPLQSHRRCPILTKNICLYGKTETSDVTRPDLPTHLAVSSTCGEMVPSKGPAWSMVPSESLLAAWVQPVSLRAPRSRWVPHRRLGRMSAPAAGVAVAAAVAWSYTQCEQKEKKRDRSGSPLGVTGVP